MDSDELSHRINTEVKRVSEKFRFLMQYKEQFQASGIEFSDLREYQPTDDASRIDWKNSAKSTKTFVKEYEEEKDMDTFIIVDVSDTMLFGTADKLKSEFAALIAATLAYSAINSGINAGIGMIGDNVTVLTPDGGQVQFQKIVHELTDFENYGGDFNMDTAMNKTIGNIKEDTAVFIISDFLDVKGEWKLKMQLANMKFRHVMSVITKDRRDYKLPDSGIMRFESPDGSKQQVVDTAEVKEEYEEKAKKNKEEIKQKLSESGSAHLEVDTRESFAANFVEYFESGKGSW
jgi:uncharacterized protein (DUF58 family)